jgi:hypothetical protein
MLLGHALSPRVFYYSLQVNVCDFNAAEYFSLEAKGTRGGEAARASFTVFKLSVANTPQPDIISGTPGSNHVRSTTFSWVQY